MQIKYLDGSRFGRAVSAGAEWVRHRRKHLNEINVFPVPDGDTGTNMALSLSATANALRDNDERDLSKVSQRAAEASIRGAKGNSGIILAHWFQGLAGHIGRRAKLSAHELADALTHATETVYGAVEKPLEGTILTVMRASSENARRAAARGADIAVMLDEIIVAAQNTLARTPEMLDVLREAKVVDAGAEGYVNFLQGMQRAMSGVPMPEFNEEELRDVVEHPPIPVGELSNRYCTEVVVRGRGFQPDRLRRRFHGMGDCLLVVTTGDLFKLHVHTNHPDEVLGIAAKLGVIEERKVDDMLQQAEERESHSHPPLIPLEAQPRTPAILCDSTGDVEESLRQRLGVEQVPLTVMFGDEVYRDKVDISIEDFYKKLQTSEHFPSTSQPPPRVFVESFDKIRSDREIIVLTISKNLSGTYRSAITATRLADRRIEVFDSGTASAGLGLLALCAARLAERGASTDEILRWLERWRQASACLFTVSTLEYLRRGGRIGRAQSLVGGLLQLRPLLTYADGAVQPVAKVRGDDRAALEMRAQLKERITPGDRIRAHFVESTPNSRREAFEEWLGQYCDVVESYRTSITPVVGTHVGPGAWGVFWVRIPDDDPLAGN
jgi:DAK2 domain fusion protein YloV